MLERSHRLAIVGNIVANRGMGMGDHTDLTEHEQSKPSKMNKRK
jgi:hypothetical protein